MVWLNNNNYLGVLFYVEELVHLLADLGAVRNCLAHFYCVVYVVDVEP
jgi:hypothetical protein